MLRMHVTLGNCFMRCMHMQQNDMAAHGEAEESAVASVKASVTVVTTADALVAAVSSGARDIEIRSHLDLTSLRRTPTRAVLVAAHPMHGKSTHLMYVGRSTRSIRVRACGGVCIRSR